jgi:CBS domain-containing protein
VHDLSLCVEDAMMKDVITISLNLTIEYAAKIMAYHKISSILVMSKDELIGILTEKDILTRVVAKGINPREALVKDVMTSPVITVGPDTSLEEANRLMQENKIKKLPVIAPNKKKLMGILSQTDFSRMQPKMMEFVKLLSHGKDDSIFCADVLCKDEGQYLEFKSTLRYDLDRKCVNASLEHVVLKTVCAFMNSEGGDLVIGISDDRKVSGLEYDYSTLKTQNRDGFENKLVTLLSTSIGDASLRFINISFPEIEGHEVCRVNVLPGAEPVFLKENGQEVFYVRTGNNSRPFSLSDALKYVKEQWA